MLRFASQPPSTDSAAMPIMQQLFFLPVYDRYHKEVAVNDIVMIEGDGNYAIFYFSSGKKLMVSKTLKEYELLLGNHHFVRIHKSYMINLHYLERFDVKYEDTVWLRNGIRVDVSRRRKKEFHAKVLDFMGHLVG